MQISTLKNSAIATFVVSIFVILIIMDGFVSVPAGHVGVIFDLGRGVMEKEYQEGINLKIPFWQKVYIMDVRRQEYTMSMAPGEGNIYGDDSIEARSKDGQVVIIDATILFHIDKDKAHVVYQTIGEEADYRRKIIRPKARATLRDAVAKFNALDLVSGKRVEILSMMNDNLKKSYAANDITLEEVILRNVTFSTEFSKAIEQKQVAFQKIKTAEYQKQEAEQLKEKKIIEAEADAEAIRLKADTLRNNPTVIQYEFVQKMAPNIKWGILPDGVTPILNMDGLTATK